MGTRNLTMVIKEHQTKVAQYGQWDGYPQGQGVKILSFLQQKANIEKLKEILPKIRFENDQDIKEKKEFAKSIGARDGWLNMEQAEQYDKQYPLDSRNLGGEILNKLLEYQDQTDIVLVNSEDFASDSLFCEWAYIIDLDNNTLEVYKGFNRAKITENDRFYNFNDAKNQYRSIKIIKSFSLDKLPDAEKFIAECSKEQNKNRNTSKDIELEL